LEVAADAWGVIDDGRLRIGERRNANKMTETKNGKEIE
jgi:hypothetical protein